MVKCRFPLVLAAATGFLSACNSADSLYSQGPWGPAHIYRDYPRYGSPWDAPRPIPVVDPLFAPTAEPVLVTEHPFLGHRKTVEVTHFEVDVPAGPIPASEGRTLPAPPHATPFPSVEAAAPYASHLDVSAAGASPPGVFSAPKRASSYAGTWRAAGPQGVSCTVKLSSVPALDLYKASTSGCGHALQGVNAWSLRDGTVILFSRGDVVARLSGEEAALSGSLTGSGASLRMSR